MTGRVGAVVLAGGRSSRFGRDKLAEVMDGRSMLAHAIEAAQAVASEVVVVAAPDADLELPPGVVLAHDERAYDGPLAGLTAGLTALRAEVEQVIVIAGDMPDLVPAVLSRLLDMVGSGSPAAILGGDGDAPPLPMALQRARAQTVAHDLLAGGERRLRALPATLEAVVVPSDVWRVDDPAAATLHDIDTQGDLLIR